MMVSAWRTVRQGGGGMEGASEREEGPILDRGATKGLQEKRTRKGRPEEAEEASHANI